MTECANLNVEILSDLFFFVSVFPYMVVQCTVVSNAGVLTQGRGAQRKPGSFSLPIGQEQCSQDVNDHASM